MTCKYCGGAKRIQIVSPVSDGAWASCFCSRPETVAIANLRDECNRQIQMINIGLGTQTPGFAAINRLLIACDAVFSAGKENK